MLCVSSIIHGFSIDKSQYFTSSKEQTSHLSWHPSQIWDGAKQVWRLLSLSRALWTFTLGDSTLTPERWKMKDDGAVWRGSIVKMAEMEMEKENAMLTDAVHRQTHKHDGFFQKWRKDDQMLDETTLYMKRQVDCSGPSLESLFRLKSIWPSCLR